MCGHNHKERITWNKTMLIAEQTTMLAVYKFILEIRVGFLINIIASQLKEFYIKVISDSEEGFIKVMRCLSE